jgi:hypothetical protein
MQEAEPGEIAYPAPGQIWIRQGGIIWTPVFTVSAGWSGHGLQYLERASWATRSRIEAKLIAIIPTAQVLSPDSAMPKATSSILALFCMGHKRPAPSHCVRNRTQLLRTKNSIQFCPQ